MVKANSEVTSNSGRKRRWYWTRLFMVLLVFAVVVMSSTLGWLYCDGVNHKRAAGYLKRRGYFLTMEPPNEALKNLSDWVRRYTGINLPKKERVLFVYNYDNYFGYRDNKEHVKLNAEDREAIWQIRHDLTRLGLTDCELTDDDLAFVGKFEGIKELFLSENLFSHRGIAHLVRLKNLWRLRLRSCELTDESLAMLGNMPELQELDLSANSISDDGVGFLSELKKMRNLNLSATSITDDALIHLQGMRELEQLSIIKNDLTGRGFKHLAGITVPFVLNAGDNRIVDEHLRYLSGTRVQSLRLRGNKINGTGLPALLELRDIDLGGNEVSDQGVIKLKACKALAFLTLSDNPITDAALPPLTALPKLEFLDIKSTKITREGLIDLGARLKLRMLKIDIDLLSKKEAAEYLRGVKIN